MSTTTQNTKSKSHDNFEVELVVMGARVALTTYKLPLQPTKLKNFDEFHKKYGKYILNASD